MKNTFVLPALFLFYFLIILFLITALNVLQFIVISFENTRETNVFTGRLLYSTKEVLPAACFLSLVILFLRIVKKPGSRLLTYIMLLLTAVLVLIFGQIGLNQFTGPGQLSAEHPYNIKQNKLNPLQEGLLYVNEIEDNNLTAIVFIRSIDSTEEDRLDFFTYGKTRIEENRLIMDTAGGRPLTFPEAAAMNPVFGSVFTSSTVLESVLDDYAVLLRDLQILLEESILEFFILCFALVFDLLSSNLIMRVTKWPLLNFLIVLLFMRGFLFLYSIIRQGFPIETGEMSPEGLFGRLLPSLGFMVLGILFFLANVIFVPFNRLTEAAENEAFK